MSTNVATNLDKLKRELLCGIEPSTLDPLVQALAEAVARLVTILAGKGSKEMAGMSVGDLSKAIMNCQKALDGVARLRSFAAGGPDSAPHAPVFELRIVPPAADGQGNS